MRIALFAGVWMLSGCAAEWPNMPNLPETITVQVTVRHGEMLRSDQKAYSLLKVDTQGKIHSCEIVLSKYPVCLLHEMRHCLEGEWHPNNVQNSEDC